ncbi:hypothetical protein SAY86_016243 [Trapa natans]|uniref:DUF4228 domain-containing protein n=1 Tax=Trapa natans TaxID=22666 RepID=A0AAN7LA05_TRANT|nr:hypothetical protein SAY86_016243 [Trapa natans]
MGNCHCQAIDTAALVIQHPSGKSEKIFGPVSAGEVMRTNPGHYLALLISTTTTVPCPNSANGDRLAAADYAPGSSVKVTRIKLLRPTDTLLLGQVYRLITAQEVMKVLSAKKTKKGRQHSMEKTMGSDLNLDSLQASKHGSQRNHKASASSASGGTPRSRAWQWQPSLHSISESAS